MKRREAKLEQESSKQSVKMDGKITPVKPIMLKLPESNRSVPLPAKQQNSPKVAPFSPP